MVSTCTPGSRERRDVTSMTCAGFGSSAIRRGRKGSLEYLRSQILFLDFPRLAVEHFGQFLGNLGDQVIGYISGDQHDPVGRRVLDEQVTVAVVDQPAGRWNIDRSDPVAGRAGDVFVVIEKLQSDQLHGQDAEQQEDEAAEHPDPGADGKALAVLNVLRKLSRNPFGSLSARSPLHLETGRSRSGRH